MTSLDSLRSDMSVLSKMIEAGLGVKEPTTTYAVAKKLYNLENGHKLKKKDAFIRQLFNRWIGAGFLTVEVVDGKRCYIFDKENVALGRTTVMVENGGEKSRTINMGPIIAINCDGKWVVINLPDLIESHLV